MTAAIYTQGTAVLAGQSADLGTSFLAAGLAGEHAGVGAGQWLTGMLACAPSDGGVSAAAPMTAVVGTAVTPVCSALRQQSAEAAGTGADVFGGSFSIETGSPVVIADDKPNFRTGAPPRDLQPV